MMKVSGVNVLIVSHCLLLLTGCVGGKPRAKSESHTLAPGSSVMSEEVKFLKIVGEIRTAMGLAKEKYSTDYSVPYWHLKLFSRATDPSGNSVQIGTIYLKQAAQNRGPDITMDLDDPHDEMVNIFLTDQRTTKAAFFPSAPGEAYPAKKLVNMLAERAQELNDPDLKNLARALDDLAKFFAGSYRSDNLKPTSVNYSGKDPTGRACGVNATFDGDGSIIQVSAFHTDARSNTSSHMYLFGLIKIPDRGCTSLSFNPNPEIPSGVSRTLEGKSLGLVFKGQFLATDNKGKIGGYSGQMSAALGLPIMGGRCEVTRLDFCADRAHLTRFTLGAESVTLLPLIGGPIFGKFEIDCRNLKIQSVKTSGS